MFASDCSCVCCRRKFSFYLHWSYRAAVMENIKLVLCGALVNTLHDIAAIYVRISADLSCQFGPEIIE